MMNKKSIQLTSQTSIIFLTIIFVAAIQLMTNPIRLTGSFNTAYLNMLMTYVVGLVSFSTFVKSKKYHVAFDEFIMLVMLLPLFMVAIYLGNSKSKAITDILKPLFFFSVIILSREYFDFKKVFENSSFKKTISFFKISILASVFVIFIMKTFFISVRSSATSISVVFITLYFFYKKDFKNFSLLVFLLLVGGKLGPIIGLFVLLMIYLLKNHKARLLMLSSFVISMLLYFVFDLEYYLVTYSEYIPAFQKLHLKKFFAGLDSNLLDKYVLGGRLSEVLSTIKSLPFDNSIMNFIHGGGLGFIYDWYTIEGAPVRMNNHGTHFTPVSVYSIYGGLFFLFFFVYILKYFLLSIKHIFNSDNFYKLLFSSYLIAAVVNSLTAYSIFTDYLLAFSIGILSKNKLEAVEQ